MMRVSSHCTPTQTSPQLKRLEILVSFLLYKRDEEVQKAFWREHLKNVKIWAPIFGHITTVVDIP
jgi:hypothetical protein